MVDEYNYDYDEYDYCEPEQEPLELLRSTSYKIIKEDEALKARETLIDYASNRLDLARDDLILALIYFKWDIDCVAEKWYDKPDFYSYESGISINPSIKKKLAKDGIQPNNSECLVCYTSKDDIDNPKDNFLSLSCGHYFCSDCWGEYLLEKTKEVNTAILSSCPQVGCNCMVPESVFIKILEKNNSSAFRAYIKSVLKNFTDFNSTVKCCPSPGCDSYIYCEQKGNKEVTCLYCEQSFCFKCLNEGHKPCTCEMVSVWDSKNKSESENIKWLQVNTKKCPACHKHIEKNQGCNHMTCQKQAGGCGHEFCWLCLGVWKGHQACNKFNDDTKTKDTIKHDLERYIHHFDRYMNHKKSLGYAIKMKAQMVINVEHLNEVKGIPYIDLQFLKEGVKTIVNSRRTLMNSYIFGYYLKKNSNQKTLFEFHQSMLESYADKLHGLLERDTIRTLLALDDYQEFNDNFNLIKNQAVDMYSATNKFLGNLISSIENNMMDQVDFKSIK